MVTKNDYENTLNDFTEHLKDRDYIVSAIVHGSYPSSVAPGLSDIDMLVVIDKFSVDKVTEVYSTFINSMPYSSYTDIFGIPIIITLKEFESKYIREIDNPRRLANMLNTYSVLFGEDLFSKFELPTISERKETVLDEIIHRNIKLRRILFNKPSRRELLHNIDKAFASAERYILAKHDEHICVSNHKEVVEKSKEYMPEDHELIAKVYDIRQNQDNYSDSEILDTFHRVIELGERVEEDIFDLVEVD